MQTAKRFIRIESNASIQPVIIMPATNVRCVKITSFIGVALAILAAVMPLVYKIANESSQPLVCYKVFLSKVPDN